MRPQSRNHSHFRVEDTDPPREGISSGAHSEWRGRIWTYTVGFHYPTGHSAVKWRTSWERHRPAQARKFLLLVIVLARARSNPGLGAPAAVSPSCLSVSGPILGREPGLAGPGLAQNVLLTQASPGRGCEQGQQTGPPASTLAVPWVFPGKWESGGEPKSPLVWGSPL